MPDVEDNSLITEAYIRANTKTPLLAEKLTSRKQLFLRLYNHLDIEHEITKTDLVDTIEILAHKFHEEGDVDWNIFWEDIQRLFPNSKDYLIDKKLLLGTDNNLHASGGKTKVFFRPVRTGKDSDLIPDRKIENIPERLKEYIAFLNERITTH